MENQSSDENMTLEEALDFVDQEVSGTTFYAGKRGLIVAAATLAQEVRNLHTQLAQEKQKH
jgi:hypothetical protein